MSFMAAGPPDENGDPSFPVMHDLNERAADLATGAEVVFVLEQGGDALHFIGQSGSNF